MRPGEPEALCFKIITPKSDDPDRSVGDTVCDADGNDDYDEDGVPNKYDGIESELAGDNGSFAKQDSEDHYEISNIYQLQAIMSFKGNLSLSDRLSAKYRLISDIDASVTQKESYDGDFDASSLPAGEGFLPIGSLNGRNTCSNTGATCFVGIFDGNGYSISKLQINRMDKHLGLFGAAGDLAGNSMRIRNVGILELNIRGGADYNRIGGLVGEQRGGEITDSYAQGVIHGGNRGGYLGGLVGVSIIIGASVADGKLAKSYAAVEVNGGRGGDSVGGLIGRSDDANGINIVESYAIGNVNGGEGRDNVGGLVGYQNAFSEAGRITDSYALGNVDGGEGDDLVGGLAGYQNNRIIENSYALGNVNGGMNDDSVGGLTGYLYSYSTITSSYAAGNTEGGEGDDKVGGIVGVSYGTITGTNFYVNGADWEGNGASCPSAALCQREDLENILDALLAENFQMMFFEIPEFEKHLEKAADNLEIWLYIIENIPSLNEDKMRIMLDKLLSIQETLGELEDGIEESSVAENSVEESSVEESSVEESSVEESSVEESSVEESSVEENSGAESSVAESSVAENSVAENSGEEDGIAANSGAENSVAESSVAENSGEESSVEESSVEESSVEESSVEESSVEESSRE